MQSSIADIVSQHEKELHAEWMRDLDASFRNDPRMSETELAEQTAEFLALLREALGHGDVDDLRGPQWTRFREFLEHVSRSRALQGFSADQTAIFVFSFKKPLFSWLRKKNEKDPGALLEQVWWATELIDKLGLHIMRTYQKAREDVISRQQAELLELSTPVVKLWDGVLALPMIGTLDSSRAQIVMESLLQRIVDTGSPIAIIDITGVPTVDTLVAQHLLKTVTAIRLMGADCIISGIRPQIAQTIVHLGVDLQGVTTKATLADALSLALKRSGLTVTNSKV
jgi:rsbT co-antagonist protein RsbR